MDKDTGTYKKHIFTNPLRPEIILPANAPSFGKEMRKEFLLDENVTFLNHCGKGAVPIVVHKEQLGLIHEFESNPELFLKVRRDEGWQRNLDVIAEFVGSHTKNLAFVENTTRGIANILTSYPFEDGDVILFNNRTHPAIKNQICHLTQTKKPDIHKMEIILPLPCSSTVIIEKYSEALQSSRNIKLAIIDAVCGSPATLFPYKKLIEMCHGYKTDVLIDGAHVPGLIPLQLESLGADFFIGNLHKWLFTPRGCAIQYVAPKFHSYIKPCVTSFGFNEAYPKPFMDQGTRSEVPYLCVEAAVKFYHWIGGYEEICRYNTDLINKATELLINSWGTAEAEYPEEEKVPFIRNILLPNMTAYKSNMNDCKRLRYDLYYRFKIWAGVFLYDENLWVRISAQVYCCLDDYEKLNRAVLILTYESEDCNEQKMSRECFRDAVFSGP